MRLVPDFLRPRLAGVTVAYYDDQGHVVTTIAYAADGTGTLPYNEPYDLLGDPFDNIVTWKILDIRWRWPA